MLTNLSFTSPFPMAANAGFNDIAVSQLQARYGLGAKNNAIYGATRAAATVPVVAATLVSQFFLYNPVGSGMNMQLLYIGLAQILATTVVNGYGLYTGTTAEIAAGTFTTPGTVYNRNINGAAGVGAYYSAYTHSGTPSLRALIGTHGATTNPTAGMVEKWFDGSIVLGPGQGVSVAATTAASTTNGLAIDAFWLEATL